MISFLPLSEGHLPLLLEWLNAPHVQQFWDKGTVWTEQGIFIGDPAWIGRGLGADVLKRLLIEYVWKHFEGCLVDPDVTNERAIRAYEKAGFVKIKDLLDREVFVMIACKNL